jgi:hypothetical protein
VHALRLKSFPTALSAFRLGDGGEENLTGHTIDHLVATIAFIAAMVLFLGLFTQTLQAAVLYQQNRHVALKASDLLDNILLSPGYPYHWGERNTTLSCFGLQQPGTTGYTISSFALMRLTSLSGEPVEYPVGSGKWYSNVSLGPGGYLFLPLGDAINYETAAMLLGVNGTYGFQLSITPLVNMSISEVEPRAPYLLTLKVEVSGPGFPLGGANLGYYLYRAYGSGKDIELELFIGTAQTDSAGVAYFDFPFDGEKEAYTIVVYAGLGGLKGVGYYIHKTYIKSTGVIPFIVDYETGKVYLAHDWDVNGEGTPPMPSYKYTAKFYVLTEEFEFQEWPAAECTGLLTYGGGGGKFYYGETTLPVGHSGFLLVMYKDTAPGEGVKYGMCIMPWGIGSPLAASILFGGVPTGNVWVASDFRHVTVGQLSYQAKILCWSLKGYQTRTPSGWRW